MSKRYRSVQNARNTVRMTETWKRCTKCKRPKVLDDFPKKRSFKDGHRNICNDCYQDRNRRNYYKRVEKAGGWREATKQPKTASAQGQNYTIDCNRCRFQEPCRADLWKTRDTPDGLHYLPLRCWAEHPHTLTAAELQISKASIDGLEATA